MIKLTATAKVHYISPIINVSERFQKRELILDDSWTNRDGQTYSNFVLIEFTGDLMPQLDNFRPGEMVTVDVMVNGREHNQRFFNTLKGRSIAHYQHQTQSSSMPGYQQNTYPSAPMPGSYAPQPTPQQGYNNQAYGQPTQQGYYQSRPTPGVNDLPFQR